MIDAQTIIYSICVFLAIVICVYVCCRLSLPYYRKKWNTKHTHEDSHILDDHNRKDPYIHDKSISGGEKKNTTIIQWPTNTECYPSKMIEEYLSIISKGVPGTIPFGVATDDQFQDISDELFAKYSRRITPHQLNIIRTMELAFMVRSGGIKSMQMRPKILKKYASGSTIDEISKQFALSPLTIIKTILSKESSAVPDEELKKYIQSVSRGNNPEIPSCIPASLANDLTSAIQNDLGSPINSEKIRNESKVFEESLAAYLRSIGVEFTTEDELRSEGSIMRATPDILMKDPIIINGQVVYWIDAKNYPNYGSKLTTSKAIIQSKKYNSLFGPGAFVYSGGIMCDVHSIEHSIALDGCFIPFINEDSQ